MISFPQEYATGGRCNPMAAMSAGLKGEMQEDYREDRQSGIRQVLFFGDS
jgi:hypothetical protein